MTEQTTLNTKQKRVHQYICMYILLMQGIEQNHRRNYNVVNYVAPPSMVEQVANVWTQLIDFMSDKHGANFDLVENMMAVRAAIDSYVVAYVDDGRDNRLTQERRRFMNMRVSALMDALKDKA